jgi:hypothetical protein
MHLVPTTSSGLGSHPSCEPPAPPENNEAAAHPRRFRARSISEYRPPGLTPVRALEQFYFTPVGRFGLQRQRVILFVSRAHNPGGVSTILKVASPLFLAAACVNLAIVCSRIDLSEGPGDSSLIGILEPDGFLLQLDGKPIPQDGPVAVGDAIRAPDGRPIEGTAMPINTQTDNRNCGSGAIALATLLCRG